MCRIGQAAFCAVLLMALVIALPIDAGVVYDEELNALSITDFPKDFPCTLARLLSINETNGWDKVSHDPASDTYTITCNLLVGSNDGTETYVQIGLKEHPSETLVMKGNVYILPFHVKGENEGLFYRVPILANRLTLGSPEDATIRAALKFDNSKPGEFGLTVGRFPKEAGKTGESFGGQFHAYNSVITSLRQEKAFASRGFVLVGQSIILHNSEISWSVGFLGYGLAQRHRAIPDIVNTVFAHGESSVENGVVKLVGCTLRDLKWAVNDFGSIDVTFVECTFRDNDHNWFLRTTPRGVTCIDCNIGEPKKGDILTASEKAKEQGRFGTVSSRRHVIVEVVGPDAKAVRGAQVTVTCEQGNPDTVDNWKQTTDATGRTPAKGAERPILLTEYTKKVTDVPNQPEFKEYSYTIEVAAPGYAQASLAGIKATESWKVIRVALKK